MLAPRRTQVRPTPQPTHPPLSVARPAERSVLIGTPETVGLVRDQLALLPGTPEPVGCILIDRLQPRAAGGLPVFGGIDDLARATRDEGLTVAIVSLPSALADAINRVRAELRRLGLIERFLPPLSELLDQTPPFTIGLGSPSVGTPAGGIAAAPRIDVAALIGRRAHELDRPSVTRILAGKRVLITGAGGSIGSELARIVASFAPAQLHLVERSENALFEIDRRLARLAPAVPRRAILHDVTDADQTLRLLVDLRPHVVFHAAAHKHVPLMEDHPALAVTNNLFGTKSIADAALAVGSERFVLVSSDKAVNPSSVMGATKRLAELYIQRLHETTARMTGGSTRFGMVRFGNVLGSACSVLTIWSAQLAEGGPLTVTDARMTRYFMTIEEAAALVIQAAALESPEEGAPGAPIYILDMGEPLSILDLARRFLRAHGFAPHLAGDTATDLGALPPVEIRVTGIRPGEKVCEELAYSAEQLRPTAHPGIRALAGSENHTGAISPAALIADLSSVRTSTDRQTVLAAIRRHVPEMAPGGAP